MTNIDLRYATLVLCLALSATGNAIIQSAISQQTADTTKPSSTDQSTAPSPDKNGIYRVGDHVAPPKLIHSAEPKFSRTERKRKVEGITTVQIVVGTDGRVTNPHVLKSSFENITNKDTEDARMLDQKALETVSKYRFAPATLDGKPVPVVMNVEVNFQIF